MQFRCHFPLSSFRFPVELKARGNGGEVLPLTNEVEIGGILWVKQQTLVLPI
jgi:hypothetical protein